MCSSWLMLLSSRIPLPWRNFANFSGYDLTNWLESRFELILYMSLLFLLLLFTLYVLLQSALLASCHQSCIVSYCLMLLCKREMLCCVINKIMHSQGIESMALKADSYNVFSHIPYLWDAQVCMFGIILITNCKSAVLSSYVNHSSFYSRTTCCDLCSIQISHVASLLKLSFVLSREVPLLFQKVCVQTFYLNIWCSCIFWGVYLPLGVNELWQVSRLLALIYVVSASREKNQFLISCNVLSENYWAAYFHQASVGTHHDLQLLSAISLKHGSQMVSKKKVCFHGLAPLG